VVRHFYTPEITELTTVLEKDARDKVLSLGADELLATPPEDIVDEILTGHLVDVPLLDRDRMTRSAPVEIPGSQPYQTRATRFEFSIPFTGQPGLFSYRPRRSVTGTPVEGVIRDDELVIAVEMANPTKEKVERERDRMISVYQSELWQLREDVKRHNDLLPETIRDLVTTRRENLLRDLDVAASLDVPIRRRPGAALPVTVARRIRVDRPSASPAERFKPEWEIKDELYENILTATRSMGLVMERFPRLFAGLGEEDIRDFFLAQLNAVYQGDAMAEVFNAAGKTDILIRWDERNVFIAECKVWRGTEKFTEAIDQLLGYMGWRDTKCAILLFVHERSVSDIVDKADEALQANANFKRMADKGSGELERRHVFHWPGDERRELTLALQVFAVPDSSDQT
jgi:hypothetical protein